MTAIESIRRGELPPVGMSNDLLEKYARRTTKRPLFCFLIIAAMPFVNEVICRIAESML